jgi:hypothetical protein
MYQVKTYVSLLVWPHKIRFIYGSSMIYTKMTLEAARKPSLKAMASVNLYKLTKNLIY